MIFHVAAVEGLVGATFRTAEFPLRTAVIESKVGIPGPVMVAPMSAAEKLAVADETRF